MKQKGAAKKGLEAKRKTLRSTAKGIPSDLNGLMSEFDFEERIAQEKIRNTFLFKSDSWLIVEGIMERILKLTHWSCYINELDRKKPEHCIEQVIQGGLATCQMVFELKHDPQDKPNTFGPEHELEEPLVPAKDTYPQQSIKIAQEKPQHNQDQLQRDGASHTQIKKELKQQGHELNQLKRRHLSTKNNGGIEGVKVKDPREVEADDDLAMKVRLQKQEARQRHLQQEKEQREKLLKERQRLLDNDTINQELQKSKYTFDNNGGLVFLNHVNTDMLPSDFKPKIKFKKALQSSDKEVTSPNSQRKVNFRQSLKSLPLTKSTATGSQLVNYNSLSKLCDQEQVSNLHPTGGSMFDFFQPAQAGLVISENKRVKFSKLKIMESPNRISPKQYRRKSSLKVNGAFDIHKLHESGKADPLANTKLLKNQQNDSFQGTFATQAADSKQFYKKTSIYSDQFERADNQPNLNKDQTDRHNMFIKNPQSLNELILKPNKPQLNKKSLQMSTKTQEQSQSGIYIEENTFGYDRVPMMAQTLPIKGSQMAQSLKYLTNNHQQFYSKQSSRKGSNDLDENKQFEELNQFIVASPTWGTMQSQSIPTQNKTNQKSKSRLGTAQYPACLPGVGHQTRPFSRANLASSQQSLRVATTAASQKQSRRSIRIRPSMTGTPNFNHLAQPPLGKAMGHGIYNYTNGSVKQSPQTGTFVNPAFSKNSGCVSLENTIKSFQQSPIPKTANAFNFNQLTTNNL